MIVSERIRRGLVKPGSIYARFGELTPFKTPKAEQLSVWAVRGQGGLRGLWGLQMDGALDGLPCLLLHGCAPAPACATLPASSTRRLPCGPSRCCCCCRSAASQQTAPPSERPSCLIQCSRSLRRQRQRRGPRCGAQAQRSSGSGSAPGCRCWGCGSRSRQVCWQACSASGVAGDAGQAKRMGMWAAHREAPGRERWVRPD